MALLATFPIMLTMAVGYAVERLKWLSPQGWEGIEQLCFRLLFPALLFKSIALSELDFAQIRSVVLSCYVVLALSVALIFSLRFWIGQQRLPDPDFTTLLQSSTRWNAFIALAAAELVLGAQGYALVAACMAALIPVINIALIIAMARFGTAKTTPKNVVMSVLKNPFVQACALGLVVNLLSMPIPSPLVETLNLIGRAALGLALISVGAAIRFERLFVKSPLLCLGVLVRPVLMPLLAYGVAWGADCNRLETAVILLVFCVPSASNGYVVAKQMGGNAQAYADILTWQTILSLGIIPLSTLVS